MLWHSRNCFKDYLQNRKQYDVFNNYCSSLKDITCGVAQGSILGPLLFILYINDIVQCSKLLKFIFIADDTNLFFSSRSIKQLRTVINEELDKLKNWFQINKLSLNANKTKFILFGGKHMLCNNLTFCLKIDGKIIEQVKCTKFLGIVIDEDLSWKQHTSHISLKISKSIGIVNVVKSILCLDLLKIVYYSLIHPYLQYCNIV